MKIWKALCMSFWMTPLVCKTGDQQMAVKAKFHLLAFKVMCTWETDCATKLCQKRCPYTFRNRFRFAKHLEKRSLDFCPHWIRMFFVSNLCILEMLEFLFVLTVALAVLQRMRWWLGCLLYSRSVCSRIFSYFTHVRKELLCLECVSHHGIRFGLFFYVKVCFPKFSA